MKKSIEVDELIIGGGLCGLVYGLTSVKNGYKVAISEAQHKVGGYATNFYRNKRKLIFDCSLHKITGVKKGNGNLREALENLGVWDLVGFEYYTELTTIIYKNQFIKIPSEGLEIKELLLNLFPDEAEGIEQLFENIQTFGYQHYMFGKLMINEYTLDKSLLKGSRQLSGITAKQYFKTLFKNNDLVEILSSLGIYLGTVTNEANAAYFLHFLYTTFFAGQSFIKNTGQYLSNILASEFVKEGGDLILKNPVSILEVDEWDNRIVADTKKRIINAKNVIATCSPHSLLKMLDCTKIDTAYLDQVQRLKPGWGHFCVYTAYDKTPVELGLSASEYLIVSDQGDDCSEQEIEQDKHYDVFTLSVTNYYKIDANNGNTLQFILLTNTSNWFELDEQKYIEKKEKIQNQILERVFKVFPILKEHLVYVESSTPRTNYKYTLSTGGSAFGYKILPKTNLGFLNNFPVMQVKVVSSWVSGPGYEAAMCLGYTHATLKHKQQMQASIYT